MKKYLLATTAFIGTACLGATAAVAAPQVRVGGAFDFQTGWTSQDLEGWSASPGPVPGVTNERGFGFLTDTEVVITVSDKLDSGLAWRLKIELEADADTVEGGQNADEVVLQFTGSWGRLELGNEDGAADQMWITANHATGAATNNDWRRWFRWREVSGADTTSRFMTDKGHRDSSDSTKLTYYTPRFAGVQIGVSYSPDRDDSGRSRAADNDASEENFWEFGATYQTKFDDVGLNLSATHARADIGNDSIKKVRSWGVGAMLTFGAFRVAGGYYDDGDGRRTIGVGNQKQDTYHAGIGYTQGPMEFGATYQRMRVGAGAAGGRHELDVYNLGAAYQIASGVQLYSQYIYADRDHATNNALDNKGHIVLAGTRVRF